MNNWNRLYGRERFLSLLFAAALVAFAVRLIQLQIVQHEDWRHEAIRQFNTITNRQPNRGEIHDRLGVPLAVTLPLTYAVGFRPVEGLDRDDVARKTSGLLGISKRDIRSRLDARQFTYLARKVDRDVKVQLEALNLKCLQFDEEPRRAYPSGYCAAALLGFTNREGRGVEGIESMMDRALSGVDFQEHRIVDAFRTNPALLSGSNDTRGADVHLTIDLQLQSIVENGLREGLASRKFARACGLLVDPRTGDILALATFPSFDPNQPGDATANDRRCWPLTDVYEPGSTLKIVPISLGLASGRYQRTTRIFCENGAYRVRGAVIHDSHPYGNLSFDEVLTLSSNIGAAKVCAAFSPSEVYDHLRAFGFGNKTLIGLSGEQAGVVPPPHKWSGPTQSTLAYGQGISCTPLQLTMAYGALAHGGMLMKPRLVKSVTYPSGKVVETPTESVRRIVSEEVANTLMTMLTGAVENGTGAAARIAGLPIAGKTGTAQKVDFASGRYFSDRYEASFIGVFPAGNPRYVLLIVVDDPQGEYYGGVVAAPVFRRIVEHMSRVRPDEFPPGLFQKENDRDTLRSSPTTPQPPRLRDAEDPVIYVAAFPSSADHDSALIRVPDVAGLSIRQAMHTLSQARLSFRITGEREIVAQLPVAGTLVPAGTSCELTGMGH